MSAGADGSNVISENGSDLNYYYLYVDKLTLNCIKEFNVS